MEEIISQLKEQLIDALNLEDISPEDMDPKAPLFGAGGLGLDSIDALEIIVLLEKNYGIRVNSGQLVVLHPDNPCPYVVAVPYMKPEVQALLKARR